FVAHIVASPYRDKVIEAFRQHKTPLHMDVELPTLQAIKSFVGIGNGVALVPAISVENEIARGELVHIPVRELHFQRKLRLAYRQESTLSHAGRAFLKVAEQFAKERGGHYRFQREKLAGSFSAICVGDVDGYKAIPHKSGPKFQTLIFHLSIGLFSCLSK